MDEELEQNTENPIEDFGSSIIRTDRGTVYVLTIVGQIEGHQLLPPTSKSTKYEHVLPLLATIEGSEQIDGLLILLNNGGGDVEAGLAISEVIASMSKPTVSLVLGGSHSIGVPLAVSAKKSFIAPSAAMTIHPVRLNGLVIGVPQTFYYFERIQERILHFAVCHRQQPHQTGGVYKADAPDGRAGRRRGQRHLRRGGGGAGPHRPHRRAVRRAGLSVWNDWEKGLKRRGRPRCFSLHKKQ